MNFWWPGRRSTAMAVVLLMVLGTLNPGCKHAFEKDVTNDPKYGDFFGVVGKWKTKDPVELYDVDKKRNCLPSRPIRLRGSRVPARTSFVR
jgi:hypothetical protein